jgi:predicted  nucleic acid-binding Zn-ribbon protein
MENLIAYLDESLVPLENKIKEYLEIEHEIRLLEVKILTAQNKVSVADELDQIEANTDIGTEETELNSYQDQMNTLLNRYNDLKSEVISMLPEKNKFVEINLGYGPSMVGYFTVDLETHIELPEPILRVVH